jgi:hypothetical protein
LIKVAFEDRCIGDVFGGLGKLKKDNAGADLEKAEYDGCNLHA